MTTSTDRFNGLIGSSAVKPAVVVATTANITLAGLQTIDGVTLINNDRVLVKNQSNAVNNGIWIASSGQWSRADDFNGLYDTQEGTLVVVSRGNTNTGRVFILTTQNPLIGTSSLQFQERLSNSGVREIQSIASLRTYEPLYAGQIITLLGHTTAGIGGGEFRADLSDTTTADDDGLTIVTTGGKRWKRILTDHINSDMFNGNAKKVIESATTGKYAIKLLSDYTVTSTISLKSNSIIDCNNFSLFANDIGVLKAEGSLGTWTNLTSNMTTYSRTINTTLSLSVGDWVFVRSEALYDDPTDMSDPTDPPPVSKYGQIFQIIRNPSPNSYTTNVSAEWAFNTADTAQVAKITAIENVEIHNLKIGDNNLYTPFTIGFNNIYLVNSKIVNPKIYKNRDAGGPDVEGRTAIKFTHCVNVTVENPIFNEIAWYGIEIKGACRNIIVKDVKGYLNRHVVSFNWHSGYGKPINCYVIGGEANQSTLAGFDTHPNSTHNCGFDFLISSDSAGDSGFQVRSKSFSVTNCTGDGNFNDGYTARGVGEQVKISNFSAKNNRRDGIRVIDYGGILTGKITCINNGDNGLNISSGIVENLSATLNDFGIRITPSDDDLETLTLSNCNAPTEDGQVSLFISNIDTYNKERLTLNSNKFYGADNTPLIASPTGYKDHTPLTDGFNKSFYPSEAGKQKGIVTLSGGTATVLTNQIKNYTGVNGSTTSGIAILDKVSLKVRTASNAGHLRYSIVNETSFTITSSNALDASVIEWEITGF